MSSVVLIRASPKIVRMFRVVLLIVAYVLTFRVFGSCFRMLAVNFGWVNFYFIFYSRQLCFRLFLTVTSERLHYALSSVGLWTTIQCCAINSHSVRYTSHRSHIAQSSVGLWTTIQSCPIPLLVVYQNYVVCEMRTLPEVRHSRTLPAAITALSRPCAKICFHPSFCSFF